MTNQEIIDASKFILDRIEAIRNMNGYLEGGGEWLGPQLHFIEDKATDILSTMEDSTEE